MGEQNKIKPANGKTAGGSERGPEVSPRSQVPHTPDQATAAIKPRPLGRGVVIGSYRQNRKGFGFVMPTQPEGHEDVFIPEGANLSAITGDTVRAQVTSTHRREGKVKYEGRITEIIKRSKSQFVGSLVKRHGVWVVLPDGNDLTSPISAPDAGSRHLKPGTKVVIELTSYPGEGRDASGVITEVLGEAGEKDVDLRGVLAQYDLPREFPSECVDQARAALDRFNQSLSREISERLDLGGELVCTIDPDDAKDYDDAISLRKLDNGNTELGVHIADVSFFVDNGSPLDAEARQRGNSVYFPGYVVPMLPEILSNGVCSLQEGVPRLCKSVFIELDQAARPVRTRFANSVIRSSKRLRYREAQGILDKLAKIPHPDGPRSPSDYDPAVVGLLGEMNELARRIQKRRTKAGQLVLALPGVDLVLSQEGKVVDAVPEDESFTHTLIEMFMVEANEAVARLLDHLGVPFMRRVHETPPPESQARLTAFLATTGHKLSGEIDRHALQRLLGSVKDTPEEFAVNLAVLKSLARAEYSPRPVGHYALASEQYAHFTSPIRRYADLTVHRLLDQYLRAGGQSAARGATDDHRRAKKIVLEKVPSYEDLVELGRHISYTERRGDEAEQELRTVKLLELLQDRIGEVFQGVVTSVTKFGIFIQLRTYLIDGLIRYEDMAGDHWIADERAGVVRGRDTGQRIVIGDIADVIIARVDVPRRELDLAIARLHRGAPGKPAGSADKKKHGKKTGLPRKSHAKGKTAGWRSSKQSRLRK